MSRPPEAKLIQHKKISILSSHGRAGNANMPHIGNFDELYDFVMEHSTPHENGCLIWNGSYSCSGYGQPQIVLRDGYGSKMFTMRQAFTVAVVGVDTTGTYIHLPKPSCGFNDCVNPDHQTFFCE